jgi:hypothetical protein
VLEEGAPLRRSLREGADAAITLLWRAANYAIGEYGGIDYASLEAEMRASGEKQLSALTVDEVREVSADIVVRTGSVAAEIIGAA